MYNASLSLFHEVLAAIVNYTPMSNKNLCGLYRRASCNVILNTETVKFKTQIMTLRKKNTNEIDQITIQMDPCQTRSSMGFTTGLLVT